jgi:hypothetical protein
MAKRSLLSRCPTYVVRLLQFICTACIVLLRLPRGLSAVHYFHSIQYTDCLHLPRFSGFLDCGNWEPYSPTVTTGSCALQPTLEFTAVHVMLFSWMQNSIMSPSGLFWYVRCLKLSELVSTHFLIVWLISIVVRKFPLEAGSFFFNKSNISCVLEQKYQWRSQHFSSVVIIWGFYGKTPPATPQTTTNPSVS